MRELTSWSYSKYSCYKLCPAQFKYKYIERIPQGPAPALERGLEIHDDAEKFMKGKLKKIPESCSDFEKEFKMIIEKDYKSEEAWAFDQDWNIVPFKSKKAFLRMKIDAHGFPTQKKIKLIDFKTGKVRKEYQEQVHLYSTAAFTIYDVEKSSTEFWYLDHDHVTPEIVYDVKDYEKMIRMWERKITPMFNDRTYSPTPNFLCNNYCDFASHKGGQCRHGR